MEETSNQPPPDVTSDGADTPSDSDSETKDRERLVSWLTKLKRHVQEKARPIVRGKKALEQLCRSGAIDKLATVVDQTDRLRDADLEEIGLEDERMQAVGRLDAHIKRRQRELRMRFARSIEKMARRREVTTETISESPLVLRVSPFVVTADFDREKATIEYAKNQLQEVHLAPDNVLDAHEEWVNRIRSKAVDSETCFRWLRRAYELVLVGRDAEYGDRVDLVDLRAPLGLLAGNIDDWRRDGQETPDPMPRWLLSYQLKHLRFDQMLEHDGERIDLGTATGDSTDDKTDVLFIRSGRDAGQYYLSIRFTEA